MKDKKKIGFWKWLFKSTISLLTGIPWALHEIMSSVAVELFFGLFFGLFGTIILTSYFGDLVGAFTAIGCVLLVLHGFYRISQE